MLVNYVWIKHASELMKTWFFLLAFSKVNSKDLIHKNYYKIIIQ